MLTILTGKVTTLVVEEDEDEVVDVEAMGRLEPSEEEVNEVKAWWTRRRLPKSDSLDRDGVYGGVVVVAEEASVLGPVCSPHSREQNHF